MRQLPRRRPQSSRSDCWPRLRLHELFILLGLAFFIAGLVYITPLVDSKANLHSRPHEVITSHAIPRRFGGLLRPARNKPITKTPTFLQPLDGLLDGSFARGSPLPEEFQIENVAGTPLPWQRWRPTAWHTETGPPPILIASQQAHRNATRRLGTEDEVIDQQGDSSVVLHKLIEELDAMDIPGAMSGPEGYIKGYFEAEDQAHTASGPGGVEALVKFTGRGEKDQAAFCGQHFGVGWLHAWNATAKDVCSRPGDGVSSTVRCRSMQDEHMTAASAPHVLCDATNLVLNTTRMRRARCPKHRPGYLCKSATYHHYDKGALAVACDWPGLNLSHFPKDHLRDIVDGMDFLPVENLPEVDTIDVTRTLLVTREIEEHANVFHALADLLNVYISLRMLGWLEDQRQVVILDNHPAAALDSLWAAVAAGGRIEALSAPWNATRKGKQRLLRRVSDLANVTLFEQAVFVPSGYTSLLFAHLYENSSCPQPTALFNGFRSFILAPLGLLTPNPKNLKQPLKVTLISRQPMTDPVTKRRKRVVRRISNEPELLAAVQSLEGVDADLVDFASLTVRQQLRLITETDILIGMHGAALAYSLLMQEHSALLELWPKADGIWRCYEHTAEWAGLLYRRWANPDPARMHKERDRSDVTEVDLEAFKQLVASLVGEVRAHRRQANAAA